MKAISDIAPELHDAMRTQFAARRRSRIERYGWGDPECAECGDTGTVPDPVGRVDQFCYCPPGNHRRYEHRMDNLWRLRVPPRVREFRVDSSPNRAAAAAVESWLVGLPWREGRNLLLIGEPGTGKTGLAVGALYAAHRAEVRGAYVNVVDWLDLMRPTKDETKAAGQDIAVRGARDARLLLLDDLGAEKASEWVTERVYLTLNARYDELRSTIVTSNMTVRQLSDRYGQRVIDRLLERGTVVPVVGSNLRR